MLEQTEVSVQWLEKLLSVSGNTATKNGKYSALVSQDKLGLAIYRRKRPVEAIVQETQDLCNVDSSKC
jgi:hypothetical protein